MLTNLLLKIFVPGADQILTPEKRVRCGIMSGITGIVCNAVLAAVKICLAVYAGSIAIAADAVNGISFADSVRHASSFIARVLRRTVELDIPKTDGICFEEFLAEINEVV